ncbi:MAG: cytidylate kinase [Candidatus Uhrbacteria bacterium GW2011_GWF2_41_16]|jgi:predicted cytidylate kinase|uniref:Cytidylate kinase n=2 Tax=Candidatus Uhriibacteriota TaxID=1752732 RepID=A0A0G0VBR7_9BACT|nr:MAG: cytidylate kinase [Candidatus Uhrbacteria bacterium GW2011_GWC2_41_11]KKR98339.1 MAG: cytidylate kinase [Candidatus Uhrbacteria bacterium GW2011_GWF2_41_16]HBP00062.1 hypothetical protein [Candidatus Uhrbacteria bacterium]
MIITLSGLPGSGKTTIAKLLAERFHMKWYSMGDMRGKMAQDRGLTIDELNALGTKEDFTDKEVDQYQKKLGETEDQFVIDSWMGWYFIPHSLKVFLTVDPDIAAQRIYEERRNDVQKDEPPYQSPEHAKQILAHRVQNSRERYLKYYGVDYQTPSNYDLIIDTTHLSPEEILSHIKNHMIK